VSNERIYVPAWFPGHHKRRSDQLSVAFSKMSGHDELPANEIERRMNAAVSRALSTPATPTKELVGKSERAIAQRESRVRKAARSKPKSP
jgi:hypothetical protein